MKQEMVINDIVVETQESKCLVIKVQTDSLPVSLKIGTVTVEEIKTLCEKVKRQRLAVKLESFLQRAYIAEEKKNYFRARRAFVLALYCEGKLRTDGRDACGYVRASLPVY